MTIPTANIVAARPSIGSPPGAWCTPNGRSSGRCARPWITAAVSVLLLVAIGVIAALTYDPDATAAAGPPGPPGSSGDSDPVSLALTGATFAALAVGVLGVLVAAGEYSTGMIRSTMTAVPHRLPVLWSKAAIVGVTIFALMTVGALAAFLLGSPLLPDRTESLGLGDEEVSRSLVGAGLYLGLVAVFGAALGALVRSSAGAISILAGVLLILPGLTSLLPDSSSDTVSPYLPSSAGSAVMTLHPSSNSLSPWAGFAVFAVWVGLTLAGAAYRLAKTDV